MYADLKDYTPQNIEFCIEEAVKEKFPMILDFKANGCDTLQQAMKLISNDLTCTFPDNEFVQRKLDDFEKQNIREEYCELEENVVPERLQHLQETLEKVKAMKKQAEDLYQSALMEVAKYAAEVKAGVKEMRLKSNETFCMALAGNYLIYTWDASNSVFVLAKAFEIPDRSEIWANEERNRAAMLELFGLEFPEVEKPQEQEDDDLPFGN